MSACWNRKPKVSQWTYTKRSKSDKCVEKANLCLAASWWNQKMAWKNCISVINIHDLTQGSGTNNIPGTTHPIPSLLKFLVRKMTQHIA